MRCLLSGVPSGFLCASDERSAQPGDEAPRRLESGVLARPPCVLLVDDQDDSRELYAQHLARVGFEVLQAANATVGIEVACRRKPHLIVMDLEMPGMGGAEAIQRLRMDVRTRHIPVVVLSGKPAVDQEMIRRTGCFAYLVKPCSFDDLEGVIRAAVDAARVA
jgi:two-component system, cell cycle response regulator DivK